LTGRLVAWLTFVGFYVALAYASRASGGDPPEDALYRYSTAWSGAIWYGITLLVVLLITRGRHRELLALRRPRSIGRAIGWSVAVIVAVFVVEAVLEPFLHAGEEQGLTPDTWDPDRAAAYAANAVVIAVIAPIVEELMFRGAGYSLLARYGQAVAIVAVGVLFGLVHGLIAGLIVLSVFGMGLAWLRAKTNSVYPCIAVHALFNAVALIVAVTVTT
jgi:CAAX protease family protein